MDEDNELFWIEVAGFVSLTLLLIFNLATAAH